MIRPTNRSLLAFLVLMPILLVPLLPRPVLAQSQGDDLADVIRAAAKGRDPNVAVEIDDQRSKQEAHGHGASITGAGQDAALKFKADAPVAGLGGGGPSASGGDTDASAKIVGGTLLANWAFWLGLALIGAGCYFNFVYIDPATKDPATGQGQHNRHNAIVCWAVGGCLVTYAAMPGWLVWLAAIGGAALLAGYVYLSIAHPLAVVALKKSGALLEGKAKANYEAVRAVVEGIKNSKPEVAGAVVEQIRKAADPGDMEPLIAATRQDYPDSVSI